VENNVNFFVKKFTFHKLLGFLFLGMALFACKRAPVSQTYIFLGHPYDWHQPNRVDPRVERIDYEVYDEIWLGGDVCSRTAEQVATMAYLDTLFDFSRVKWALGNHDLDYGNPEQLIQQLPHPPFFTSWQDGFCLTVLNTNLFWPYPSHPPQRDCQQKMAQWQMVKNVADTITKASHWVILHHHALFTALKLDVGQDTIRDFNINPEPFYAGCDRASNLTTQWYPSFLEAQQRGVQLVFIGGDLGVRAKKTAYRTEAGIWLLGAGINNSVSRAYAPDYVTDFKPDQVLILTYQPKGRQLYWRFEKLNDLAGVGQ
jgi:hypothetical protein